MSTENIDNEAETGDSKPAEAPPPESTVAKQPREIGGRDGPDPTRYGDWEKNGRCVDF